MSEFLIKHYWHTPLSRSMNQAKAPKLDSTTGSLVRLLDALLVDGFGEASATISIHSTDTTKAIVTENNHGYAITTRISISGCDDDYFNSEFEIVEIIDTSSYIINVGVHSLSADDNVESADGILVKIPSLGWTKEYSSIDRAVYRMKGGSRRRLWVDNTVVGLARVRGAWDSSGTNLSSLIHPFPDLTQTNTSPRWVHYIHPSNTGPYGITTDIGWTLVGTDRFFYLSIQYYYGQNQVRYYSHRATHAFGDTNAYNAEDTSATILTGGIGTMSTSTGIDSVHRFSRWLEPYNYQQVYAGTWMNEPFCTFNRFIAPMADNVGWALGVGIGRGQTSITNTIDVIPIAQPILLIDQIAAGIRSEMPGMAVCPFYLNAMYPQNTIINVNGIRYMVMSTAYSSNADADGCFLVQIDGDMHTLKGIV